MLSNSLDHIEAKLQSIMDSALGVTSRMSQQASLIKNLVAALNGIDIPADGILPHPISLTISMHPDNVMFWENRNDLLDIFSKTLQESAAEMGIYFQIKPFIFLRGEDSLSLEEIRVLPNKNIPNISDTSTLDSASNIEKKDNALSSLSAFLIINGIDIIQLDFVATNIGRSESNHIVLDDPTASRNHAQIRNNHGKYILIDLNSTGGTYINNNRINQQELRTGDIIMLGQSKLIFGIENDIQHGDTDKTAIDIP